VILHKSSGFLRRFSHLLLLLAACSDGKNARSPSQVGATSSSEIATVVKVDWTTAEPSVGYVEYGPAPDLGSRTPTETAPTKTHAMPLLGMTADTSCYYRVVTADGAETVASEVKSIRTGSLPVGMPPLTQTGAGQQGTIVVPVIGPTTSVVVLNPKGEIVWYHTDSRKLDFYRARLSVDGKSLLYNAARISGTPAQDSELIRVALDGSSSTSIPIPYLAHDFVEHPDGTLAAIVFEDREVAGTTVRGNKIVEVAPDGTQRTVWSTWDCFDPAVVQGDDMQQGGTFANVFDYDTAAGVYTLGMRNFSSIAKINRQTRVCEWVLGGAASTFSFAQGSARFLHSHQFQVRGDHILVMDNDGAGNHRSRVLEYQLDFQNKLATQVWSYIPNPSVYTFVLGEPQRFDDGTTFINWGAAGQMERLDSTGASTWKLNTGAGYVFGFHTLANSLYSAGAPPAGLPSDGQSPQGQGPSGAGYSLTARSCRIHRESRTRTLSWPRSSSRCR
jgi:hypothetical protein